MSMEQRNTVVAFIDRQTNSSLKTQHRKLKTNLCVNDHYLSQGGAKYTRGTFKLIDRKQTDNAMAKKEKDIYIYTNKSKNDTT